MNRLILVIGRFQFGRAFVLLTLPLVFAGCGSPKAAPPPPPKQAGPPAVFRDDSPTRVFSNEEEVPGISYAFEGGKGSVRVTMEIEGISSTGTAVPTSLNDILFKAEGTGRISVSFKRPSPERRNGLVTIGCLSGLEDSSATYEPELWYHLPGAIITLESPLSESSNPIVEGKEVVLARYVARNIPRDLRLTFKAIFTKDPVAPRTKAGIKPPL